MPTSRTRKALLPLAILLIAGAAAWFLMYSKPAARKALPRVSSPMVLTTTAVKGRIELTIKGLGTVKPAQETVLRPRVFGTVIELAPNLEPGGLVKAGEVLLRIDPEDYANEVNRKESALAKAKAEYDLEMGQQKVARSEFNQLSKTMPQAVKDSALALRVPHLAQAKAALSTAQTDLKQARTNLERTTLVAPYNALVTARNVSLGSQASTSDTLATLVGTDLYWIEAAIPLDKVQALGLNHVQNLPATVVTASGQERQGTVLRSLGTLDATTRMGRVLIAVPNPLNLTDSTTFKRNENIPLLLGDQAHVTLSAGALDQVVELPRSALRGNNIVWVAVPNADKQQIPGNAAAKAEPAIQEKALREHVSNAQPGASQSTQQTGSPQNTSQSIPQGIPSGYTLDIRTVEPVWKDTEHAYVAQGIEPGDLLVVSDLATPIQGMPVRLPAPPVPVPTQAFEGARP